MRKHTIDQIFEELSKQGFTCVVTTLGGTNSLGTVVMIEGYFRSVVAAAYNLGADSSSEDSWQKKGYADRYAKLRDMRPHHLQLHELLTKHDGPYVGLLQGDALDEALDRK